MMLSSSLGKITSPSKCCATSFATASCSTYRLSPTAMIFPPLWCVQNRFWEVLIATFLVYGITLAVHWVLFIIAYVVLAIYFKKAHLVLRRSFAMMRGRHIWLGPGRQIELEAQRLCRRLDPKSVFVPDLVGPPVTDEPLKKRPPARQVIPCRLTGDLPICQSPGLVHTAARRRWHRVVMQEISSQTSRRTTAITSAFDQAVLVWLKISLLSFGGPAGQIAVMHRLLVEELKMGQRDGFSTR